MTKQATIPKGADRFLFMLSPVIVFAFAFCMYLVIPFNEKLVAKDLNMGLFFILAMGGLSTIGIITAGWASNNKYSLMGGLRSSCQMISYEVVLVLAILGVIMITQTLSLKQIVKAQEKIWFIVYQPLGFLLYLIAATAEVNRLPFDIPEAESELVGGYHTEYAGIRFAIFFLAEYASMLIISCVACILYLGGWLGPKFLPGFIWFLLKVYAIIFLLMWVRWTYPRLRVDQLMSFCWKILIPLGFLNIFLTGILMKLNIIS
jgi:NADH-quinone oxidoreductase subunit H